MSHRTEAPRFRHVSSSLIIGLALLIAACGRNDDAAADVEPGAAQPTPTTSPSNSTTPPTEAPMSAPHTLRFTAGETKIDVRLTDNPAAKDLVSLLPLTLRFEEFNGREKIGYLPRKLDIDGAPGIKPENGDLIYFAPWGNLGFYYNADGMDLSDDVIHIGDFAASPEQLGELEDTYVTIELVASADS